MRVSWTASVMLVGLAAPSAAQVGGPVAPAVNAQGFPIARKGVNALARLRYDSNILRGVSRNTPGAQRKADQNLFVGADVDLVQPISRQDVFLSGSAGYDFYRYNKRLERERIDLTGGAHVRVGQNCTLTPSASYFRAQSDLGDLIGFGSLSNTEERVTVGGDADCGAGVGLRYGGGYHRQRVRNSGALRQALNFDTDTVTANIGYYRPSLGRIGVYGSYTNGSYPNRVLPDENGALVGDGIKSYAAGLNYQRQLGSLLTGDVSVGVTRVSPKVGGTDDFTGLSYSGSLTYRRDPVLATAKFSRDAQQSNLIQSSYAIVERYDLAFQYAFSGQLSANANAYYAERDFTVAPSLLPLPNLRDDDRTYYVSGGLSYRPLPFVEVLFDAARIQRSSNLKMFDYKATQLTLTVKLKV